MLSSLHRVAPSQPPPCSSFTYLPPPARGLIPHHSYLPTSPTPSLDFLRTPLAGVSYADVLLRPSSSNLVAKEPEEALLLGMNTADPEQGADGGGHGSAGLVTTGSVAASAARPPAVQADESEQSPRNAGEEALLRRAGRAGERFGHHEPEELFETLRQSHKHCCCCT